MSIPYLHPFKSNLGTISLPKKFTYPFYYEPHPLCEIAAKEVQEYLQHQKEWSHPFFTSDKENEKGIGKMFGILVVKNVKNQLGYLVSFSGKLAGTNTHRYFVPPVFDMLQQQSYFLQEEKVLNQLNSELEALEQDKTYNTLQKQLKEFKNSEQQEIQLLRKQIIADRKKRKQQRTLAKNQLSEQEYSELLNQLAKESIVSKVQLNQLIQNWQQRIEKLKDQLKPYEKAISDVKNLRKTRSKALQHYLFSQYQFLNKEGTKKNLLQLFSNTAFEIPPAGAGECAAPKLLQYAFTNQLIPVCMAEFWWGDSPKSEIRKHKQYYPACQGKCKPILGHMLQGLTIDENPLLQNPAIGKEITVIYEDEYLLAVNKPADFLSVPGKSISDSVYSRIKQQYPKATGPLLVHRLDMATSGLLLIAKSKEIHEQLQRQFIKRQVQKSYVALLDGLPKLNEGIIDLPLRLDIDDRPRQLVCFKHGKPAQTRWKKIAFKDGKTKVHFFPITGRTHQLRMHAAHPMGLNTAIVGDDLYGKKSDRLYLHAASLCFTHPVSKKKIELKIEAEF
ncbi:RluA family pseudouridine synthase [Ochrovirga pacifica]|uniref:RluA family pseudouridine synthase n=1 Tax=Ochrovirga pacifica TaxID=1042376 RepID=UPI000255A285|nr:pseudouridine synthase [Ochrovirga pacifica]